MEQAWAGEGCVQTIGWQETDEGRRGLVLSLQVHSTTCTKTCTDAHIHTQCVYTENVHNLYIARKTVEMTQAVWDGFTDTQPDQHSKALHVQRCAKQEVGPMCLLTRLFPVNHEGVLEDDLLGLLPDQNPVTSENTHFHVFLIHSVSLPLLNRQLVYPMVRSLNIQPLPLLCLLPARIQCPGNAHKNI